MRTLVTRAVLPVLLAALALGVSACSDDEPDADPTSSPTASGDAGASTPEESFSAGTPDASEPTDPTATASGASGGPTTYDDAQARVDAADQEPQELMRFETAAGTYCLLDSDFAIGCELASGGIPDADYCGDGPTQNIGRVVLDLTGDGDPQPECNSDTIREPDAPVVEVGTVAVSSATGVQCLVEDIGVTCLDPGRTQGFFLGQDSYTVFTAG